MFRIAVFLGALLIISCSNAEDVPAKDKAAQYVEAGNFDKAYKVLLPIAQAGDAEAQFGLAMLISNGYGSAQGKSDAEQDKLVLHWLKLSTKGGNEKTRLWLADSYSNGWYGLEKNQELSNCYRDIGLDVSRCFQMSSEITNE
ncbi:hypothetical protein [Microbulbifer sp. GL-2]|uniref:hypothetical protein n=1 Tax=Microbulbifer sp. GL-2 TaxID=2591606 RepID=UPI0011621027|nr:hypothetical protein [Microbulbifer sp. GL-2]BBM03561.1 hypothetical protein GL2_36350 [Microbulbifer sp. GL-2]